MKKSDAAKKNAGKKIKSSGDSFISGNSSNCCNAGNTGNFEDFVGGFGFSSVKMIGSEMAKVFCENSPNSGKKGKLVLVTAVSPNEFGVGKTTVSIGLADAINSMDKSCILSLREPSMGPVFGIKGGGVGGGKSVLLPSEDIDLHFTGDFHAIASATNLLAAIVDNHIFQGNELCIDPSKIFVKRCLDVNDRSLREVCYKIRDYQVKTGFVITAASEIMAIVALCDGKNKDEVLRELKRRLGDILVAQSVSGEPIFAHGLHAENAMARLLEDCVMPNAVRSAGGSLALVHMGPFANIAHGCSSVLATKFALEKADFCVTEAGFGCDLGGEKFVDIKSRILGRSPDVAVLVASVKTVKKQGEGVLEKGFENVKKHIHILRDEFCLPFCVAINRHADDAEEDLKELLALCEKEGVKAVVCAPFTQGGEGCTDLAKCALQLACVGDEKKSENSVQQLSCKFAYNMADSVVCKIEKVAKNIYGAGRVIFSSTAMEKIEFAQRSGFDNFFVNIAKTPFSFTDDKNVLGAPENFDFHVTDIEIRSGAKMIVATAGNMLLMPALGKKSRYLEF